MAEYIEREAAIKAVCDCKPHTCRLDDCGKGCQEVRAIISVPAADVRPVVLCKDCDMYECHEYDEGIKYVCRLFKRQMQEADFCSYGEKREES